MKNDYEPSNEKPNNESERKPKSTPLTDNSRRAFVRKSLATGIIAAQPSILAGLIRADGGGGGTTTNPWGTTMPGTTYPGTTYATTSQWGTTYPQTTYPQTTYATTYVTTAAPDPKKWKWMCRITYVGPKDTPYTEAQLLSLDMQYKLPVNPFHTPPTGPPTGSRKVSGPDVVAYWVPSRPEDEHILTSRWRDPENPPLKNWLNPADNKYYAVYEYAYYEQEDVFEAPGP